MTLSLNQQLRNLREDADLTQAEVAKRLAVTWCSVSAWDTGRRSPGIHYALAYAAVTRRRIVVATRSGVILCDLTEVLADPAAFRRPRRTLDAVAFRMRINPHAARGLERRMEKGAAVRLASIEAYLAALDCRIGFAPVAKQAA